MPNFEQAECKRVYFLPKRRQNYWNLFELLFIKSWCWSIVSNTRFYLSCIFMSNKRRLFVKPVLLIKNEWTQPNQHIMKHLKHISILLIVASTFLSSCTLLASSPLPRTRPHHYHHHYNYHNDEPASNNQEEVLYWIETPRRCQVSKCSCAHFEAEKCRCSNPPCVHCGHPRDKHNK